MIEINDRGRWNMLDITGAEHIEIRIRWDGTVIWVSDKEGTILRICRIEKIDLVDERNLDGDLPDNMKGE